MKTVNEVKNSYTYYLQEKLPEINRMLYGKEISLDDMKRNIKNYIWNATYSYKVNGQTKYTKKQWFLSQVDQCPNKMKLYYLCVNSIMKAEETIARG